MRRDITEGDRSARGRLSECISATLPITNGKSAGCDGPRWRCSMRRSATCCRTSFPNSCATPRRRLWEFRDKAKELAFAWFSDQDVQKRVAQRLEEFGLDATAIEARVLQHCRSQLNEFDRLLASAESRRLKAVRALAEFRSSLRRHIATSNRASAARSAMAKLKTQLTMTSARKIAANRRNAVKSTGPRGAAAKHRTRRNAERHGLAPA